MNFSRSEDMRFVVISLAFIVLAGVVGSKLLKKNNDNLNVKNVQVSNNSKCCVVCTKENERACGDICLYEGLSCLEDKGCACNKESES